MPPKATFKKHTRPKHRLSCWLYTEVPDKLLHVSDPPLNSFEIRLFGSPPTLLWPRSLSFNSQFNHLTFDFHISSDDIFCINNSTSQRMTCSSFHHTVSMRYQWIVSPTHSTNIFSAHCHPSMTRCFTFFLMRLPSSFSLDISTNFTCFFFDGRNWECTLQRH